MTHYRGATWQERGGFDVADHSPFITVFVVDGIRQATYGTTNRGSITASMRHGAAARV